MSTLRAAKGAIYTPIKRDETGRALCRWCQRKVPKGRRTFCGAPCVHEWNMRTDPGYARRQVWERDHGVCGVCGLDTERINRIADRLAKLALGYRDWHQDRAPWVTFPSAIPRLAQLEILCALVNLYMGHWVSEISSYNEGSVRIPVLRRHLWEADHIVPVVEGGGECGLDGLRTLCLRCHKHETRALAKRRAEARKAP